MKHNLGKMLIFLLATLMLQAKEFDYSLSIDKKNPYVKEAVLLTLELNQSDRRKTLLFDFDLKPNDSYSFQRLKRDQSGTVHRYTYLIYPLRSGDMNITFELEKKVTGVDSSAYSFSGGSDITMQRVTVKTSVALPPVTLEVKALPEDTLLVGDFNLTYSIKKHEAKAHEPLPFQINIEGKGYPPLLASLLPKDGNFTRFTEKPIVKSQTSTEGTQNTVTYPMALSYNKSFKLPPLAIKCFNPQTEKSYELIIPEQSFTITQPDPATLIDSINSPETLKVDWSWLSSLLSYFIVFTAGYLSALSWRWKKRSLSQKDNPLKAKIEKCKDEKALLQVLMAADSKRFAPSIEKLEASLYGNGKINVNKFKKELLEMPL